MELSEKEQKHSEIMESLAKICRSNKKGFKEGETDKIDAIRELMQDSGYHEILLPSAQIWRKDFESPIDVIVSSHADVVGSISKCSSKLKEKDEGIYYSGTYDNAGTNAALVISALEGNLPNNAIIAFTADEETGRCNGAKQVLEYARNSGYEPVCIALDVTYEGFDEGYLFTVENASSGSKKNEDMDYLNGLAETMVAIDPEDNQSCTFVRISKKAVPSEMDRKYLAKDSGWFDEAQAYSQEYARSFSLCLPCDGEMHANKGVDVKEPAFEGYVNALEYMIHAMAKSPDLEQILVKVKKENTLFVEQAKEMARKEEEAYKAKHASHYSSGYYGRSSYSKDMSEDEYYDFMAYNESYGVHNYQARYDDYDVDEYKHCSPDERGYVESWYDEEVFPTFKSYVDSVIEDIVEVSYEYEPEDKQYFVDESLCYMPDDVVDWFGDLSHASNVVSQIFDNVHGLNYEDSSYEDLDSALAKADEYDADDGYEIESEDAFSDEPISSEEKEDYEEDDYSGYYDEI